MHYDMESRGERATLNEHCDALVAVSGRRYVPGGVVVDVRVLDCERWPHTVRSWTAPEAEITYVD